MEASATDPVARRLAEVERRVTGRLADALHRRDGSVEEWRVLTSLVDVSVRPMGEIAELEGLPGPTLSRIVERLVAAGQVRRDSDARDRRRVLVGLTSAGRARYRELRRLVDEEQATLRAVIGAGELAELERLLSLAARRLVEAETPRSGP